MAANAVMEREVSDNCYSICGESCQRFLVGLWDCLLCRDESFEDSERVRKALELALEETGDLDDENDNGYTADEPRDSPPLLESPLLPQCKLL